VDPSKLSQKQKLVAYKLLMARHAVDPVAYATDCLGQTLTPKQIEVLEAIRRPPYRVLVRSANNVGKTFLNACLASWKYDSFNPSVTLATAPTDRQVTDLLFKELRTIRPLNYDFLPHANRLESAPNHFVHGFTAKDEESFKGQHEDELLLIFDEAVGIDRAFWSAAETMFLGIPEHGWICTYNPRDPTSYAYQAEASGLWNVVHMSALDHPNVLAELRGEAPPIPGAIRLQRVMDRIATECEYVGSRQSDQNCFEFPLGSNRWYKPLTPEFEVQILGRWPTSSFNSVWGPGILDIARRTIQIDPSWPLQIGCDVARYGDDDTTIAVRKGTALIHLEAHSGWSTKQTADQLRWLCNRYVAPGGDPKRIPCTIDDTGGYGAGVVDYPEGYRFIGINSSETAKDNTKYGNVRSELWWMTRLAADAGGFVTGCIIEGKDLLDQLEGDLISTRWSLGSSNRRVVESKAMTKARLYRSPDLADAVNLAWYPI
jgi:hypothetical protein